MKTIETTRGEIYFIREIEEQVNDAKRYTSYTKIGLIKFTKDEDRFSEHRLGEHQTGNPRILEIASRVETDCVSVVETYVHRQFGKMRRLGEWFQLSDEQFVTAVDFCRQVADRFKGEISYLDEAKTLKDQVSSGVKIVGNDDTGHWYTEYCRADHVMKSFATLEKIYKAQMKEAAALGEDVSENADVLDVAREKFNEENFTLKYPDLYRQFITEQISITGRFTVEKQKDLDLIDDPMIAEFDAVANQMAALLGSSDALVSSGQQIHSIHLELLTANKQAEIDKQIAEAHLKVMCGSADGIEGVCSWKRVEKAKQVLDQKALKAAYPSEFGEFSEKVTSTRVVPKKTSQLAVE
jgi:ribosomal protein S18